MKIQSQEQLHRFTISLHDFEDSREFLKRAKSHDLGTSEQLALLFAAVVLFVRPFTRNELGASSKAATSLRITWFDGLTDDQCALHERFQELRNKVLAHAESSVYPTGIDGETGVLSSRRSALYDLWTQVPVDGAIALLDLLIRQCHNKRADYARVLRGKSSP